MPEIGRDDVHDHHAKGERKICQGKLCTSNVQTEKNYAVKVCHHEDCQDTNKGNPLLLCMRCDEVHHLGSGSSHARFDVPERPSTNLFRTPSSHSAGSDSGNEDDLDSSPRVDKKTRGYSSGKRMFKLTTAAKKKPRRHNTEDPGREFFSIKFHDGSIEDYQIEVVPALKGRSLRESLEPLFEARDFSFVTHSVFLDSSHTPLPLAFDTFPLGGNVLHVRANEDVKVDERVINIVRNSYAEDKNNPDELTRPKSASFLSRSGSFTTKGKDKDKAAMKKQEYDDRDKEKDSQLLKNSQRGKKNIMSFLGDDPGGVQTSTSLPVLSGGLHVTGGGTLPRPKSSSNRLTGLFNQPKAVKDDALRGTLKDSLERYTLYGLEESAGSECSFKDQIEDDIKLEISWTDVVDNNKIEFMTKKQKDQQEAIWELLSTEASYISKLFVVKKLFLQCLRNLQSEGFLPDIDAAKLFSNIEEICEVNLGFWTNYLCKVVENLYEYWKSTYIYSGQARQTKDLLNPMDMEESFQMFDSQFDPYIKYCMEEATCLKYFKEKFNENEDFRAYITWCEEHHQCTDRLKLNDLLVKPMQRVTKYPLLLKATYSKTLDEDTKEHINTMRDKVEVFVGKVNGAMRVKHELERLKATAERIYDSYNVVEAVSEEMEKMLQDYSSYDLLRPMPGMATDQHRCVIHDGPLRLLEKQGKMDVYVFLFTDLLLITKAKKGDKFKVIKPPLQVDKLFVTASKDQGTFLLIYTNEYNIAVQAFALQGTTADQTQWIDAIKKAQKMFMIAKLGQGSPGVFQMRMGSENDLLSPSGLVTAVGLSPSTARLNRRSSSASSILSVESDSDEESGIAFAATNSSVQSDSVQTSASSIQSSEKDRTKDGETNVINDTGSTTRKTSQSDNQFPGGEHVHSEAVTRLRSDSITRISRSSSAPQQERPRVDIVSLTRSSSAPQGPARQRGPGVRDCVIMKRRAVEEEDDLLTSSSVSLEDSAGDPEIQTPSSQSSSVDFPSLPAQVPHHSEPAVASELNNQEVELSAVTTNPDSSSTTTDTERGASPTLLAGPEPQQMSEEVRSDESSSNSHVDESELQLGTDTNSSPSEMVCSPGFQALQNLSESLEAAATMKVDGAVRQRPYIKSNLIEQQKIQSAINVPEAPRKKTALLKRSSPVASRKFRSESVVVSKEKKDHSISGILEKIRIAAAGSSDSTVNETLSGKVGKPVKRLSEPVRAPLKPDKSRSPVGLDLMDSVCKDIGRKERSASSVEGGTSLSAAHKKSMSLSDLLSIGKDLTSNRDKRRNKETGKDKTSSKRMEQEASPTQGCSTDDDPTFPTSGEEQEQKEEKKYSRLSKLRRKTSRAGEMKDGIASGPNIDHKKASRHFLRESLMLETSEYV